MLFWNFKAKKDTDNNRSCIEAAINILPPPISGRYLRREYFTLAEIPLLRGVGVGLLCILEQVQDAWLSPTLETTTRMLNMPIPGEKRKINYFSMYWVKAVYVVDEKYCWRFVYFSIKL